MALKGAPGRDEPASGDDGGSVVGMRYMEDVEESVEATRARE